MTSASSNLHLYWFSGTTLYSRIIRAVTGGGYTHVAILVNGRFYEANRGGVVVLTGRAIEERTDKAVAWFTLPLTEAHATVTRHYLDMSIGQPYSWSEAFLAGVSSLTGWRIKLNWYAAYICSGLAAEVLSLNGQTFPKPPSTISPNELAAWLGVTPYPTRKAA